MGIWFILVFFVYVCLCVNLQFRYRASTAPQSSRPTDFGGPSEGIPANQPSQQRQQYMKQSSTPEFSHPSVPQSHIPTSPPVPTSFHDSPGTDVRLHKMFSPAERQISEYGSFLGDISYDTENLLKEQSQRYAHYEFEAMKKKDPTSEW